MGFNLNWYLIHLGEKKTTPRGDVRLEIPQEIKIIIKREKSSSARLNPCTVTALYQPIKEQ